MAEKELKVEELSYKKIVQQNFTMQKILYIVTLVSSVGMILLGALLCWGLRSMFTERENIATAVLLTFFGVVIPFVEVFVIFLCIVLIGDLILGTISFFLCKTWTKKYTEDSQRLRQYRIYMGISYGLLVPKILCILKLLLGEMNIMLLAMFVLYAGVVAIGIRNTYTERIVENNQTNTML